MGLVDIHSHILHCVDDGSGSLETSVKMVEESCLQGVTDIILTPHFNSEILVSDEEIVGRYNQLKNAVKEKGINVNLFLGREVYYDSELKKVLPTLSNATLNNTKYLLIEFSLRQEYEISEVVYELKLMGYIPIVAHFERYFYATEETAREVKDYGGLIQLNVNSIVGKNKKHYLKLVKRLIKGKLVDFISSDVHDGRDYLMAKGREYIEKKYGKVVANDLFVSNAKEIIKG